MKTKYLLLGIVLFCSTSLYAGTFEVDGINYSTLGGDSVAVCSRSSKYVGAIIIPATVQYADITYRVTAVAANAFSDCSNLISITLGKNLQSIGTSAFENCATLTEIIIPTSVSSFAKNVFEGCTNLKKVIWNAKQCNDFIVAIGNVTIPFSDCPVQSIVFGDSVEYIPSYMCSGLSSLTSISFGKHIKKIGLCAFRACKNLNSVTIPSALIDNSAFAECTGLTSITFQNSVKIIGSSAFSGCTGLKSINIPNSVTTIEEGAFKNGSAIRTVTIGRGIKSIGYDAFLGCSSLVDFNIRAQLPPAVYYNSNPWVLQVPSGLLLVVNVPCGATAAYEAASAWSRVKYFEEITPYILSVSSADYSMGATNLLIEPNCDNHSIAQFEAVPLEGYYFVAWNDGSTTNPRVIRVTQDTAFVATFAAKGSTVENIILDKSEITLQPNETYQLIATITPTEALNKNITWKTDDATIATVENGLITAVNYGKTTITATTEDGGKTATCEVEVGVPVSNITLDYTEIILTPSSSKKLTATISPDNATNKNFTWASSDENVAAVANGWVIGVAEGTVTITATTEDGGYTATCAVTVQATTTDIKYQDAQDMSVRNLFENGTIYILRNGEKYTIDGRKVE